MMEKDNESRLTRVETEMSFHREFVKEIKTSIDNLGKEIHGVTTEMRKERAADMNHLKEKISRLRFFFWVSQYPKLVLAALIAYTLLVTDEAREFVLSLIFK